MALASDAMGLGVPPLLAQIIAEGGNGPIAITPAGTSFSTSTKIQASQNMVLASSFAAGACVGLPLVGGDSGSLLAEVFYITNTGTATLQVFASTAILIAANGSNSSLQQLTTKQSMIVWPMTSIQWGGIIV